MSDNDAQLLDISGLPDFEALFNAPDSKDDSSNVEVSDPIVQVILEPTQPVLATMENPALSKMEVEWSEIGNEFVWPGSHIGEQNITIMNDALNKPDNVEPAHVFNADVLGGVLLQPRSPPKPSGRKRKGTKSASGPKKVNITRKRCKESIPRLEAERTAVLDKTDKLESEIKLKHSNLAGLHGKKYNEKVLMFSREDEKFSTEAEVRMMDEDYQRHQKQKSQKQAGYVEFLESDLPVREKFLNILETELHELDLEIEKKLNYN